ncbi:MAG TPA: dTMP kinase [Candidatus Acidoferrales bacterium]|nr:dTMP kinase [Candidatus Acidoferrales bacterium]
MLRLISFEGGDGAGKTTQLRYLEQYLRASGRSYVSTREPGATALGQTIRQALLQTGREGLAPAAEVFLYLADRAQHVDKVIRPALAQNRLVLSDRFADSTLAYQGYGRGLDLSWLRSLNEIASGGIAPDLTFLLDLPPAVGLARARERRVSDRHDPLSAPADRFERETLEFHERVRRGFLELARMEPHRIVVIDASLPPLEVHRRIKKIVAQRIAEG